MKTKISADIAPHRARTIDLRPKPAESGVIERPTSNVQRSAYRVQRQTSKVVAPTVERQSRGWLSYGLIAIGASLLGLLSLDLGVGQWLVGLAGVAALILRLDSRYSFGAALLTLALVPIFLIAGRHSLAENYAVYCYYFLVFGVIRALWELKKLKVKN